MHFSLCAIALGIALSSIALPAVAATASVKNSAPASAEPSAPAKNPVVLRVNGKEFRYDDVIREIRSLGPQAQQLPPPVVWQQVTQSMIVTSLLAEKADAKKLSNDPEVKERLKGIEQQVIADVYVRREIQPQITAEKVKAKYDEFVSKFKPEDEVRARHILVSSEAEAKDLITQIKGGADFSKLAQEKSKDTGSARQGGDLGFFNRSAMVKEFSEAAFAMNVNQVSEKPVKTDFGWHVVRVEEKRKSTAPSIDQVRPQIENQIGQELLAKLVKEIQEKAKIERFNPDGSVPKVEPKPEKSGNSAQQ